MIFFDSDGCLRVDGDRDISRVSRERWSPSNVSIMRCPAAWAVDKIFPAPADPFGAAEVGSAAHKVLELLYSLSPGERSEGAARTILAGLNPTDDTDVVFPEVGRRGEWLAAVWEKTVGVFGMEDPTAVGVFSTEYNVRGVLSGVPLNGFVDRIDSLPDGRLVVVDYKTGKVKKPGKFGDEHGDQIRTYVAALRGEGFEVASGRLLYTSGGVAREVEVSAESTTGVVDRFVESFTVMKECSTAGVFPAYRSALCGWCPLVLVCPSASGVQPRTDRAKLGPKLVGDGGLCSGAVAGDTGAMNKAVSWSRGEAPGHMERVEGGLNPNSYAATGFCGLSSWATELVMKHCEATGSSATPQQVKALTYTLDSMVRKVYFDTTGGAGFVAGSGLATRIRGVLRTVLDFTPVPFGAGVDELDAWAGRVVSRCNTILNTALELADASYGDAPWRELAGK